MSKFTAEEKLQAVNRYLTGKESSYNIGESLGVSHGVILEWIKRYEHNSINAFVKPYTTYTPQFKMDVLNYMTEHGTSSVETAAIFNVSSPSNVRTWKRQFEAHGMDALQSKQKGRPSMKNESTQKSKQVVSEGSKEGLEARIKQLEMENEYLKKLNALVQNKEKSPKKTKHK